ncbi:hypothetical protein CALCODRAFT_487240, partial [Calocera cornea HHB12733]
PQQQQQQQQQQPQQQQPRAYSPVLFDPELEINIDFDLGRAATPAPAPQPHYDNWVRDLQALGYLEKPKPKPLPDRPLLPVWSPWRVPAKDPGPVPKFDLGRASPEPLFRAPTTPPRPPSPLRPLSPTPSFFNEPHLAPAVVAPPKPKPEPEPAPAPAPAPRKINLLKDKEAARAVLDRLKARRDEQAKEAAEWEKRIEQETRESARMLAEMDRALA